jgi:PAS domain S-box-containing protein
VNLLSFSRRWKRASLILAAASAAVVVLWFFSTRPPPVPQRMLRIGFESNPPVQIRTENGFSGLAVDTVNEAAKRAGIKLEWVETGTSSEEAFRKGLVDLWPLMVDFPDRRKRVHFARPWMHSSNVLLVRDGAPNPDREFRGGIAVFNMPLHLRLAREQFPKAHIVEVPEIEDIMKQVCKGVDAGFLEARAALTLLREKSQECPSLTLRVHTVPGLTFDAGVASTFESAGAADKIQREIDNMFRNGTLAVFIAKYNYFGLDDTWASYEQMEAEKKWRWLTWAIGSLVFALGLTLWQASSLRQRKRAEVALRESEERFRNLANTAPVMIVASGPDGKATFFNRVWLDFTGRTMEQELGYGWAEGVHPDDLDDCLSSYASSFEGRRNCHIEYRLRRTDGEYRSVVCNGVPRFGPDGVFAGYIASCIDITDAKRAQEEALARQKLESVGQLARGIAHDFNNLLGGILATTELALADRAEGSFPEEELLTMRTAAIRGGEIVRQLMTYGGKESSAFEPIDLSLLVHEILQLLKVSISKYAILETDLGEGLPAVHGNPAQIRQVVMNLVTNASEAIGDRAGVIRVTTARVRVDPDAHVTGAADLSPGNYQKLEISDTGSGMTSEVQTRIFDPFFTTKSTGRGLGLAAVQGVVRSHFGAIKVVSSLGQGTRFEVLLPCTDQQAQLIPDIVAQPSASEAARIIGTVLVVEDEDTLRLAVSRMLRKKGVSVIEARDGSAAVELFRANEPDIALVLLDVTLPRMSGLEVFAELRRIRPDIKVIITTAYSQETTVPTIGDQQSWAFIRKPYQLNDLWNLIWLACRQKGMTTHAASDLPVS